MLKVTIYHSLNEHRALILNPAFLLLLLYQCLFTGHTALMNVTTELKNKAVVNVVLKSNKVIIIVVL